MTVIGFLSIAPVREGSMAEDVAAAIEALDEHPVSYETTPMGTTIEAEDIGTLLDAAGAAHEAVDADRVSTFLKLTRLHYNNHIAKNIPVYANRKTA